MTYEAFSEMGTVLGSASFILLDDTRDIVWAASKMTKFFKHESCGKCTPCREGTYWLDKVLDRIIAGKATSATSIISMISPEICKAQRCAR